MFTKEDFKAALSTTAKFTRGHNYRHSCSMTRDISRHCPTHVYHSAVVTVDVVDLYH